MPPPLLKIPVAAPAAAAAEEEACSSDANASAAPSATTPGPAPPSGATAALFMALSGEFAAQRAAGVDVNAHQDAASLAALDAALRRHCAAYCADPAADWQRCVRSRVDARACAGDSDAPGGFSSLTTRFPPALALALAAALPATHTGPKTTTCATWWRWRRTCSR